MTASNSAADSPVPDATANQGIDEERVEAAEQYVEQLRVFYAHAAVHALSMIVIVLVNLVTNLYAGTAGQWSAWWSIWAFVGWIAGLAVHGLVVWLNRPPSSGPSWEQRQVDKIVSR